MTSLSRRKFLKLGGLTLAALATNTNSKSFGRSISSSSNFDFVIRNGRSFVDGAWSTFDIGISSLGKMTVSREPLIANRIIDVSGKIVAPGFIDLLADNSANPQNTFRVFEKYKLGDGVTTALQMHGGAGDAGEFYTHFEAQKHLVNYGVSTKVMDIRNKYHTIAERLKAVESSLDGGALAVSHSPEYQSNTSWNELLSYGQLAKKYNRPMFLHTRYSSKERELLGVQEALRLSVEAGCRVHICHLNSTGGTFNMNQALDMIRKARIAGSDVTTCVYPYSYWATYVHSERFKEGWMERYDMDYSDLEVVGTGERLTQESFEKYRQTKGILVAAKEGCQPMDATVKPALMEDFCMIGSDGGIETEPRANNHPRGAACFATAIRYALDEKIPLERMIAKMTSRTCQLIGTPMKNRGEIKNNYIADITVFDPDTIDGEATNAKPNQFSKGIELVVVNGKIAFENGAPTDLDAGTSIRY